ncbi:MAG: nucleoside hydrolase [Caldilineales bacterium]|nr:nucleoside hydrolase [Caldilineales bacterium]
MRHLIIDTDTASDDAVAILMALRAPDVTVDAITIVSGNMPVAQGSINARYTVELCQDETPVYEGCTRPLVRDVFHAHYFHGPDGMGDMGYPAPKRPAAPGHAVPELIRRFGAAPGQIELVTLGPLTNIAAALSQEPRLADWVKHCYVMGGAAWAVGNVTPAAEYNIWCDPEAARIVFHSGMAVTMIGWELCRGEAAITPDEMETIYGFATEWARFAIDCNKHALDACMNLQGDPGLGLPDPVAMAVALDPAVCPRRSKHYVEVSLDELTRGMTIVDQLAVTSTEPYRDPHWFGPRQPNVEVCWQIDARRWKELLYQTLR